LEKRDIENSEGFQLAGDQGSDIGAFIPPFDWVRKPKDLTAFPKREYGLKP
jgi:hypothetical protein